MWAPPRPVSRGANPGRTPLRSSRRHPNAAWRFGRRHTGQCGAPRCVKRVIPSSRICFDCVIAESGRGHVKFSPIDTLDTTWPLQIEAHYPSDEGQLAKEIRERENVPPNRAHQEPGALLLRENSQIQASRSTTSRSVEWIKWWTP